MIEYKKFITRDYVRANPHKLFIFGDNLQRAGFGGQARQMRNEPNAYGIITKRLPRYTEDAYFTDAEYEENCRIIDEDIDKIHDAKPTILVFPENGIGTGLAELEQKAPMTFRYLQKALYELKYLYSEVEF